MDSMEEIYLKHGKMVYGFLLTRTQDPDLAEELTQETFYRAVKNIGKYKGKSSVSTWLEKSENWARVTYYRAKERVVKEAEKL